MSYIVKVHRNASFVDGGSSISGHVYLEFIDTNSSELSKQLGFNVRKDEKLIDILNGKAKIKGTVPFISCL